VVDGVDLGVAPGELTALVGPNGSGKSTLTALLAGGLGGGRGRVEVAGRPLASLPAPERAALVGWLPQETAPAFAFTVAETVAFGLERGRPGLGLAGPEERERIARVLDRLGLAELASRPLASLSGGERQRALLASVLAPEPAILLLDEPTAALDPHQAARVMELLRPLAAAGRAVFTVTHDLNLASLFADRVHLLARGRIAASGTPAEVFRPERLVEVYGPGLLLQPHPRTGRPMVLPDRAAGKEGP
jgi:iron complex transport system ATP-binding protein